MGTVRITAGQEAGSGTNLEFFVVTGTREPPIVCLADNNGFPFVRDIYGRGVQHQGKDGVHVTVRFESAAIGNGLAVNLFQPNMTGDFTVIPLA